ncbi:TolC family protein [Spirosoma taeanense]|uniref:TolC family protein n=1 Tax=Spirosoma taeanense TaxID=2735870 RepID=A0A6M5Y4P9_9BACT|nr:TolC family protein [Spirosoma taeanense]QJW88161.1 TolC family protein [Spirosoma taeanense]
MAISREVQAQNKVSGSEKATATQPGAAAEPLGDTLYFDLQRSLADQLVPFDSLVQIGVRNAPSLKEDDASIEGRLERYRFTRTVVLQYVYPFANYQTGNQTLLAAGTLNNYDQYQLTNGYRAGLHIQIPVAELFGRKHRMREAYSEYRGAIARREVTRQQFRRELIRLYQGMLTAQKILQIRIRDEQATLVAFRVAELDFQNGKGNPADFARASNLYAQAQAGVAEQRGSFSQYFYELETLVGVPLSELKR